MSAPAMISIAPLAWPASTDGDGRRVAGMLHGLAVELEAVWRARGLAERLRGEFISGGQVELLAQRLEAVSSAAVPVGHDAAHLAGVLEEWVPEASAVLCLAGEHRREALATVRGWARLTRRGLLDCSRLVPGLARVIGELEISGRAIVAADAALLACVHVPDPGPRRE